MKKLQTIVATLLLVIGVSVAAIPQTVGAISCSDPVNCATTGVNASGGAKQSSSLPLTKIINILLYIIGAVAVIMIIVGGLRYVLSGGDSSSVSGAKNTILYAVVGLAIAILAYSIVNFVITNIK